ncbi:iron-containing alcohol dehydrogenase [Mycobacterium lacus]|uniref:Alcohol dehydrogenase n=2 Tax=Mycobacterium lacus TaxID=169765 RepID=A0A7I7NER8_9MYCO|nr:iron-containing alcohol dehydrogenase [Mycobacterium lacus]MCV7123949.1 iron-containing alcohol dehydrogenase [Mycobacterium lacus]BBX94833.1 alcohol dehydrogenase [Mycobacterium lacus]
MDTAANPQSATTPEIGLLRAPHEVLFGAGARHALGRVLSGMGSRAFVCTDPVIAGTLAFAEAISEIRDCGIEVAVFAATEPELPLGNVTVAVDTARTVFPDAVVGFGGGSALDLAKLVALGLVTNAPLADFYGENCIPSKVLPVIAVPTTAGTGSEVTPVAVLTDPSRNSKVGISSPYLVPVAAVVDPELTLTCPPAVTAFSGIDALTHAIESYSARTHTLNLSHPLPVFVGANRLSAAFGLEAAGALARNIVTAVTQGRDLGARTAMAYGSMLAGLAFATAGTHLSHAIQYPVGDATHTPHGLGVGLLLPYVMEACLPTAVGQFARIGEAMGVTESGTGTDGAAVAAIRFVVTLRHRIGVPHTLSRIGLSRRDLPRIIEQAAAVGRLVSNAPGADPRQLIAPVVERAFAGTSDIFSNSDEIGSDEIGAPA